MVDAAADTVSSAVAGTGRAEGVKAIPRPPPGGALLSFTDLTIHLERLRAAYRNTKGHCHG
jgi:hypothetical protein